MNRHRLVVRETSRQKSTQINSWRDERMDGQTNKQLDRQTEERYMLTWMDGRTYTGIDGWTDRQMLKYMNRWT